MKFALVLTPALILAAACGAPEAEHEEGSVSLTVVKMTKNGPVVTDHLLDEKSAQFVRENRALPKHTLNGDVATAENALAWVDSGCSGNALWLYSEANGAGSMLCVDSDADSGGWGGAIDLNNYQFSRFTCIAPGRCFTMFVPWAGNVRSFWPGNDRGMIYDFDASGTSQYFGAWGPRQNVESYAYSADRVWFYVIR